MRVFINGRFLAQSITGVQRYAAELVKAFDRLLDSGELDADRFFFTLAVPRNAESSLHLKHIPIKRIGRFTGQLWEQIELPLYVRDGLLLNPCNAAPALIHNQVVTMHDAAVFAVPETYSLAFRTYCRTLMRRAGKVAARIITDSAFSRDELIRHLGVRDAAVRVVPLGGDHMNSIPPDTSVLAKHDLTRRPFVLAAGSMSPNKNFRSIAQAAKLLNGLDFDVVIAGVACKVFNRSVGPLPNWVKQLGYVSDGELRALYEHAACFVFPSFYEGFGLPPLEAMACGCPVIVSNAASLPEVCGDAALYCNPHSPEDIAEKITSLMSDGALREKLRHAGFERAAMYTWDNCARLTAKVLEEALAQ